MKVTGENIFKIENTAFAVGTSESGYTLNYSVDGVTFTAFDDATPAGENLLVTGLPHGLYYKLVGNTGDVEVRR